MIPINKPWLGDEEKQELLNVIEENSLTSPSKEGGKRVQEFENLLRNYLDVKHVIAVNSGTAALHAALLSLSITKGDEVILPSFTFVATANSIIASGAKPVFVDINKNDYTVDIEDLNNKITDKTRAIIPVHLYGHPSDMDEINSIARDHSLHVIEDACQSLGSTYLQKQTGTLGKMGCFSFYASKVLTTGEGGAIATDDDNIADRLKMIRNHGMIHGYDTTVFGLNLRLPELSAAIGKIQMKKINQMLKIRRTNADLLFDGLKKFEYSGIIELPEETSKKKFNWYLFTLKFRNNSNRDLLKNHLVSQGIGATVYYDPPVHHTPYYKEFTSDYIDTSSGYLKNTDFAWKHVLSLPVHPLVSESDIGKIIDIFNASL